MYCCQGEHYRIYCVCVVNPLFKSVPIIVWPKKGYTTQPSPYEFFPSTTTCGCVVYIITDVCTYTYLSYLCSCTHTYQHTYVSSNTHVRTCVHTYLYIVNGAYEHG